MTIYTREARRSARLRISLARIDIRHIDLAICMAEASRNHPEDVAETRNSAKLSEIHTGEPPPQATARRGTRARKRYYNNHASDAIATA